MSDRPLDWSALGYDADPVPGDPEVVRAGGQGYLDMADRLDRIVASLGGVTVGGSSGSQAVSALLEGAEQVRVDAERARGRYRAAGEALVAYAFAHDLAQQITVQALYAARSAKQDAASARLLAARRDEMAEQFRASGDTDEARVWANRASQARVDAAAADERVAAQKVVAAQAAADWDTAARVAIEKIDAAAGADGLDDSWWDDWGAKVVKILASVAEWVGQVPWCGVLSGG